MFCNLIIEVIDLSDTSIYNPIAGTGSLSILIAEDIFTNWLLYEKYMNVLGHTFKIVENGIMVLDELEQKKYDLLLMDLEMPLMSGEEALRIIRSGTRNINKDIPVIALTGYEEKDFNDSNGFNAFVSKPIEFTDLARKISEVIFGKPGGTSL
jgi:CheY-like chemotaxis protein